ncbi:hypothetical protein BACCIP111895_01958 [Neobacillus rhizosphaerae]|uniref:Apea-like HEPN domain-containing protein n=1 Tax=Neobacillus rhizosphaerae TaxID=2880965 RepID=A0ABM9EQ92_9BACI|nr:hypothetical protein [Neobacillus rhizosphaerae]CAH2714782.1 hypothetical protein BACCIP111895_01958 [Neobacillus rhizosphaerae]
MFNQRTVDNLAYCEIVDKIVEINNHVKNFWSRAQGWAPLEAAELLTKSRLDWLSSLSNSLYKWENEPISGAEEGDLILAWANLGALVEGTMKLFLSVYYNDYKSDINAIVQRKKTVDPDGAMFNGLREFFYRSVWLDEEREEKNDWLVKIQSKRNAIHAYKDRDISKFSTYRKEVKNYLIFLIDILKRVPYPDDHFGPDLSII